MRPKVRNYTNACDQKVQISRFAAIGKARSNKNLACDRIGPTRFKNCVSRFVLQGRKSKIIEIGQK